MVTCDKLAFMALAESSIKRLASEINTQSRIRDVYSPYDCGNGGTSRVNMFPWTIRAARLYIAVVLIRSITPTFVLLFI